MTEGLPLEQVREWRRYTSRLTEGQWDLSALFHVAISIVPALCAEVERLREREKVLREACQAVNDFAKYTPPTRLIAALDKVIEICRAALAEQGEGGQDANG